MLSSLIVSCFADRTLQKRQYVRGRPPPCHVCGRQCRSTSLQGQHFKSHTTTRIPCLEPGCNKFFKTPETFNLHLLGFHQGEWKVDCSKYGGTFYNQHSLEAHMATHVKDREQTCDVCKKSCLSTEGFQTHMRRKHERIRARIVEIEDQAISMRVTR